MCPPEGKEETKEGSNRKSLSLFMVNMLANWMRFHLMGGRMLLLLERKKAKKGRKMKEKRKERGSRRSRKKRKRRKEKRKERGKNGGSREGGPLF